MRKAALLVACALVAGSPLLGAQEGSQPSTSTVRDLIGTWTLVSTDQGVEAGKPAMVPNPRGLLIVDGGGHIFEAITRGAGRQGGAPPTPQSDPAALFAIYSGFWGDYAADVTQKRLTFRPRGAVSPNVMGSEFSRSYDLRGDLLTITSQAGEPHTRIATRWTWERVPNVENLSPGYRQVVGFWEHVVEQRVNLTAGTSTPDAKRAPSVIVYTPAGYVGVHFPPLDRPRFAGAEPTEAEARNALRGYVGYFGALGVYPGMVFHQILAGISPTAGSTLKRFYELKGTDLNIRFPPATNQQGQQTTTLVTLRRLSGVKEMVR
jgi:hypothetical protein